MELAQTPPPKRLPAGKIAQTGWKIKWNLCLRKLRKSGLQKSGELGNLGTSVCSKTSKLLKLWSAKTPNKQTPKLWSDVPKVLKLRNFESLEFSAQKPGNSKTLVLFRTPNSGLQQLLLLHRVHDCNAKLEFSKGIDQPGNFVLLGKLLGFRVLAQVFSQCFCSICRSCCIYGLIMSQRFGGWSWNEDVNSQGYSCGGGGGEE